MIDAKVRGQAEQIFKDIFASSDILERTHFLRSMEHLTNKYAHSLYICITYICYWISIIGKVSHPSPRNGQESSPTKSPTERLPHDLRVPSSDALKKLKSLRQKISDDHSIYVDDGGLDQSEIHSERSPPPYEEPRRQNDRVLKPRSSESALENSEQHINRADMFRSVGSPNAARYREPSRHRVEEASVQCDMSTAEETLEDEEEQEGEEEERAEMHDRSTSMTPVSDTDSEGEEGGRAEGRGKEGRVERDEERGRGEEGGGVTYVSNSCQTEREEPEEERWYRPLVFLHREKQSERFEEEGKGKSKARDGADGPWEEQGGGGDDLSCLSGSWGGDRPAYGERGKGESSVRDEDIGLYVGGVRVDIPLARVRISDEWGDIKQRVPSLSPHPPSPYHRSRHQLHDKPRTLHYPHQHEPTLHLHRTDIRPTHLPPPSVPISLAKGKGGYSPRPGPLSGASRSTAHRSAAAAHAPPRDSLDLSGLSLEVREYTIIHI
jgi:hypothetical protein